MSLNEHTAVTIKSVYPKKRQDVVKWSGWGYNDTKFQTESKCTRLTGIRYPISGKTLSKMNPYIREKFGIDHKMSETMELKMPVSFPEPELNLEFMEALKTLKIEYSINGEDRLMRCHGQNIKDLISLRNGKFERIPDVVLWPINHDEVVEIVKLAHQFNVVIIPYGGGTNVSGSVTCPQQEARCISVLDTSQMNRMLWLDKENLVARFEAGIVGQDLERTLSKEGLTMGHEPDSQEFSTLGGWVATRASGMKRNVYGNIEDMVLQVKMVTCKGVLERTISAPRVSCGPDFNQIILGSEGTLGVVTEVLVKVCPLPMVKKYGSLVFPDFESGVKCLREIAKQRCQPASIRLIDNEQFQFGHALSADSGFFSGLLEKFNKFALTSIKGYECDKIAISTLLFEGEKDEVERQEMRIYEIAKRFQGFSAGETNGMKGYMLTFVIAYIRDFLYDFNICGESFETSVPWDKCQQLCDNVRAVLTSDLKILGIKYYAISFRVSQAYASGACVYFYCGFKYEPHEDPVEIYETIKNRARDEVLASGGSISHHHGVGKINSRWFKQSISEVGVNLYKSAKIELDPKNIFATGNFLMPEDEIDFSKVSKL